MIPVDNCIISGCNSQICADKAYTSTCRWNCKDMCYKRAVCKKINNKCQWVSTPAFNKCMNNCNYS